MTTPGITTGFSSDVLHDLVSTQTDRARARLSEHSESEFPEISAWRRVYSQMGLKPTQYRCASESLLRRFRKDDDLPSIHPVIDFCNAVSVAHGIPVAVFDLRQISGSLRVRPADGTEKYESFGGDVEHPAPGEIIFADEDGWAHARRWVNRQSGRSAVKPATSDILVVVEALHDGAADDVPKALDDIRQGLRDLWDVDPTSAVLTSRAPRFEI
nr:phenylalanine--tRNA ligase beta subunit-related protein [Kineosporia mesophila]